MTFSLLARDPVTGALGGASATGNLCVGAWVQRGKAGIGISASQGHFPSTLWGENVLEELANGHLPKKAVKQTVEPDSGRHWRQLLAMDNSGNGAIFSGENNIPEIGEIVQPGICAGGNMLSGNDIVEAMVSGYLSCPGSFLRRLLAGLKAGEKQGGDVRGLLSAAILIISENHPPIDIRVDYAENPLERLSDLASHVEEQDYSSWMRSLPTSNSPHPIH